MNDKNSQNLTILHVSDIHRTPDEPVSNQNILAALIADLQRQQQKENLPKPDILVISGDLTQAAREDEYDEAYELIDRLKDELTLPDLSRVVLTPGNHDIDWDASEAVFKSGLRKPSEVDDALLFTHGPLYFWTDEKTYAQRLARFRAFYRRIYKREYGAMRRDQYSIHAYPDLGVCFTGLNSSDRVDHMRSQGSICVDALFAAEERLREELSVESADCIKIAVWHHDLNWLGRKEHEDGLEPSILGHLADAGYDLALCGHAHRTNFNEYTYSNFRLPIVAAGSLCAGAHQRAESTPRLYNLIQIQGNTVRVHTRFRETKDTPWRADTRSGCSYFDIPLAACLKQPREPKGLATEPMAIPDEYYVKLIRDFEYLDISGVDNDRTIRLKLNDVYVKLRVIPDEDEPERETAGNSNEFGAFDIHTALKRYRLLVIVGDPGSGKSTFLKFIALIIGRARMENDPGLAQTRLNLSAPLPVPIFISLWDFSDYIRRNGKADDNTLLRYIVERFGEYRIFLDEADIRAMLISGVCCLLFDGLDEVPTETGRARISRLVEAFVADYPDNRYVLTSRVRGYTGGAILRGDFRRCDIQDFDDNDIQHFARNWFCALLNVTPEEMDQSDSPAHQQYEALIRGVTMPRVRILAVNPLLMTVIAIVHCNRKRLPEQRVELYDECIDVLLGQRKEAEIQGILAAATDDHETDKKRRYERKWTRKRFAEIALSLLLQEQEEEITKQRVIEILTEPFLARHNCSAEQAQIEVELFLDHHKLRSGLLVSRRSQSYRFVHLTFQEYLAAWALAGHSDYWSLARPHLREQKWFETLQLLGGEFAQNSDELLCIYLDRLMSEMGKSITDQAPIIALCANIVRDTQDVANLKPNTRKTYEGALRGTLGVFKPEEKVPGKTQLEVLEALAGLGRAVKAQLISASKSQHYKVRSRAVALLVPHLQDDDLFAMTHIFDDRSKETIKTYLRALLERDEERTKNLLGSLTQSGCKLAEAVLELHWYLDVDLFSFTVFDLLFSWLRGCDWYRYDNRYFYTHLVTAISGYIKAAIERDENRFKMFLKERNNQKKITLLAVAA
ncbi:MAG: NACHT domain-containing protein, partial [Gammaproteobacteria bacterium]|nr:NACHT domain-containing protein [Gammaproteobacteria bacterium]